MNSWVLTTLLQHYQWQLSLYAVIGIAAVSLVAWQVSSLVPAFSQARQLNTETFQKKMKRPYYAANHAWNRKWSVPYVLLIFGLVMPFCLTMTAQPWWKVLLDSVLILMVYDFCYYMMHRFLFHNNGFLRGPLKWMHAVHHQQHNPCQRDSGFIHPLEVALGLGLYTVTIVILSRLLGNFHVVTLVITWFAFAQINTHNHALWTEQRFPFTYLHYISELHHNHHARFTAGNFATISPLYDWAFGSLDRGAGWLQRNRSGSRSNYRARSGSHIEDDAGPH